MIDSLRVLAAACLAAAVAVPCVAQSGRVKRPAQPVHTERTPEPVEEVAPPPPTRRPAAPVDATFKVEYVGGTLKLQSGGDVRLTIRDGKVSFVGKDVNHEVYADRVAKVTYGQTVRERTAEGIGVGVVVPAAGVLLGKSKTTKHFLEIVWTGVPNGGIVVQVDKDDYRALIHALEQATGLDVNREPEPIIRDIKP